MLEHLIKKIWKKQKNEIDDNSNTKASEEAAVTQLEAEQEYPLPYIYQRRNTYGPEALGPPPESDDLMHALVPVMDEIGTNTGITDVFIQNHYSWIDYSSPEYPETYQHHFAWVEIAAVKDGVPYFLDFDIIDMSYELWRSDIVSVKPTKCVGKDSLEITALQSFYPPEEYRKVIEELTPEEIEEKNQELADRLGIPPSVIVGELEMYQERDLGFEQQLIGVIREAPEVKAVVDKYRAIYARAAEEYLVVKSE